MERTGMNEDSKALYGWAEISPGTAVEAGASGTWQITYHAGFYGIDDGGVLKISWRFASDWVPPQFSDAGKP
ncbi:MAG: hypothetical protein O3B73_15080, partial [bacterium]|nr:hypothetical protein [bacterium]